ncbi:MAG: family 20 glycosylhydrolase [Pseudomonadota bacterium]|nr:family 20 glycosylhydrolase [Pseudomonadota bacterium]
MPNTDRIDAAPEAPVAVSWECISNMARENAFAARLTLHNRSEQPIAAGWAVCFNTCRKVVPGSVAPGYAIDHINGDLFRLSATAPGAGWPAGAALVITYDAQFWAISMTDAPLGFYLVPGDGGRAADLGDPHIVPFARPEQRHRGALDRTPLADAAGRYVENSSASLLAPEHVGRITPRPLVAQFGDVACTLTRRTSIVFSEGLSGEAALLRAMLDQLPDQADGAAARILLDIAAVDVAASAGSPAHEAYQLDIEPGAVRIRGAGAHGVFNAIQSLRQLLANGSGALPTGRVADAPRFAYRGMMLDVARHFASKETVMRLLDCMALYKLNRFHFHLTDDEGWRFAVPALPELTAIGARRGVATDGQACLPPSFGSGADVERSAGSGHYSAADFVAILRYAHARHIEVIPEFNLPGHARAAVVAMRARHDRLRAAGDVDGAERYLLDDAGDRSVYESVQLWHDNVICIALPSVDRFIDAVVAELVALYRSAGVPLRTVHTGGDEVPAGAWLGSPRCQALMAARGWTGIAALRSDFLARCRAILARHGVALAGWEETALEHQLVDGRDRLVPRPQPAAGGGGMLVYAWNNAWGWGQEDGAYRLANAGCQVVLANCANLYFDLAQAKDPDEPGYYWCGFVSVRDAFVFCPLDMVATAGTEPMGGPVPPQALAAMTRLDAGGMACIVGIQGQLWGENARSRERIEYLAAPRLIALAERAWASDPGWSAIGDAHLRAARIACDWNEFANRLGQRDLARLDASPLAYGYRLPPPGAVLADDAYRANVALPGLALHYTIDGSEPDAHSARYAGPVPAAPAIVAFRVATFDTRGRKSRTVTLEPDHADYE